MTVLPMSKFHAPRYCHVEYDKILDRRKKEKKDDVHSTHGSHMNQEDKGNPPCREKNNKVTQ